jgi:hypothetical protein
MLWPDSNSNDNDSEIDFPELNLDSTTAGLHTPHGQHRLG